MKINPKKVPGFKLSLGDSRFLQFFRVVSRDDKANPELQVFLGGLFQLPA